MLLIGVNRSPYTRRVAITLEAYGLPYEQRDLSGFGNRAEVRAARLPSASRPSAATHARGGKVTDILRSFSGTPTPG